MKLSRISLGVATMCAAAALAGAARAQIPASVSMSDVYSNKFPATVADLVGINAAQQARDFAVNNNPGSPWQGTVYVSRRAMTDPASPAFATAQVFYWKAQNPSDPFSGTLQPSGPDLNQADGHAVYPEGFTPHANDFWAIAVSDDDLVYSTALNSGKLVRFDPDLKNATVVDTSLTTTFIRTIEAYGKGINTEIWFNYGSGTTTGGIVRMKATAVDAENRPTAFERLSFVPLTFGGSLYAQGQINSARDSYYVSFFPVAGAKQGPAKVAWPSGVRDAAYPAYEIGSSTGLVLDSMDRVVYAIGYSDLVNSNRTGTLAALHPETGENLSVPAQFRPTNLGPGYGNHILLSRYSDRHIFYLGAGVNGTPANVLGVVATDLPAPSPRNVRVQNLGTGSSLRLTWTPANDPEVTGVFIYRSTSAGTLGTALNATPNSGTSYIDNGLSAGQHYYYTLVSQGLDPFMGTTYDGVPSAQVQGVPTVLQAPDAPSNVSITDTEVGGELVVKWTTPAANAEAINIYRSQIADQLGELVREVVEPAPGAEMTWNDTGLANGVTYYYTVRAANVVGESSNTEQVPGVPTDKVVPTFAGIKAVQDLGFPGVRVTWDPAQDRSTPITYNIYTGPALDRVNYAAPVASAVGTNFFDLKTLPLGEYTVVAVRARDTSGNEETNTKTLFATPTRSIVDPDQGGGVNRDKFDPHPDPNVPALWPAGVGGTKGVAPDLVLPTWAAGAYFLSTNDAPGKSAYTLTIPSAGNYDISAWWPNIESLLTPNYTFHITYPDGSTQDVVVDMQGGPAASGGNGARWNTLVADKNLTPGTLTIVGDATTTTNTDPLKTNVSSAIRAKLNIVPKQVAIYTATVAPTIDGVVNPSEWSAASIITLGKPNQDVVGGNWTGPADYTGQFRLLWNNDGLFISGVVTDDVLSFKEGLPTESLSHWDSLEVFLGLDPDANPARTAYQVPGDYQILITGYREGGALKGVMGEGGGRLNFPSEFGEHEVAFAQTANGYSFEAFIPWFYVEQLGLPRPALNQVIGFNLQGIDNDKGDVLAQDSAFSLSTLGSSWQSPQNWIKAVLSGTPPARPRGDVNLDGVFDSLDVLEALRVVGGLSSVGAEALPFGDVNGDGKVTLEDVNKMQDALRRGVSP